MIHWKEAVKRGTVINPKTLRSARRLMTKLSEKGFKWYSGARYDHNESHWEDGKSNTYYHVAVGMYGDLKYESSVGVTSRDPYIVIPFEDVDWSEDESERYAKHMRDEIIKAYCRIRKIDNTIPDDVLDFMKDASLKALENNTKLEEWNEL